MKVLQVIDRLNIGGAERVLVDLTNILHQKGITVSVLTLVHPGKLSTHLDPKIHFINLNRTNRLSLSKLYQLNQICKQFDIVHAHLRYNFRYVALSKLIFGGKYRLLLHDHFGDIENDTSIPLGLIFFLKRNSWFAGVSQPLVDWAVKKIGLKKSNVFFMPNIVIKKKVTRKNILSSPNVKILLVSNFREAKNHVFACELLGSLRKSLVFEACFVGKEIDSQFMKGVHELIQKHRLNDVVTIEHHCDDVQSSLYKFDLAIHTAYQESGPLVLIEYLAQQLPFVAFKTGEVSAQINSAIPDFFLTNFEITEWIDRMATILSDPEKYKGIMEVTFNSIYSSDAYGLRCLNIYTQMMMNERFK